MSFNWSEVAPPSPAADAVVYGGGRFVAVGSSSGVRGVSSTLFSLDNGRTWAPSTTSNGGGFLDICFGDDGQFVGVGPNKIGTSPDGDVWTSRTGPVPQFWAAVTYGAGKYVAVAEGGDGDAMTSPDGVVWTRRALPAASTDYSSIAFGGGMFVTIAAYGGSIAASSPDGIVWTARTMPSSADWRSVAYGNGVFVAIARNSDKAATSVNGTSWAASTLPVVDYWSSITFANGLFVATATNSDIVATSEDGVVWASHQLPAVRYWYDIAGNDDGVFVIVGPSAQIAVTAPDTPPVTPPFWYGFRLSHEVP